MSEQKFLFVFTEAPYQSARVREGLDAVLLGSAFGIELSVLFTHNAVFSLVSGQHASENGLKPFTKAFAALPDFDVDKIYLDHASALARGIEESHLMLDAQMLEADEIKSLFKQQNRIFTF